MESLSTDTKNHLTLASAHLQTIKREEQRLAVRLLAVERCARLANASSEQADLSHDEEESEFEEIIANIEAVRYDLGTYIRQIHDRVANIERGLAEAKAESCTDTFVRYIEEDARLCARDLAVAREGYDDLIENLHAITHTRDQ